MDEVYNNEEAVQTVNSSDTPTGKKGKKKTVALICVIGALLLAAAAALLWGLDIFPGAGKESHSGKLYWNIDGETFVNDSASGLTSRRKTNGFFNVRFFTDGKIEEYKVTDPRLMIKIDRLYLMGLVFDEEGIVTDVVDLENVCGGEIASYFYVMKVEGNKITANSMDNGTGIQQEFAINENTKIYNVVIENILESRPYSPNHPYGGTLLLGDGGGYGDNQPESMYGITISNVVCNSSAGICLDGYLKDSVISNIVNRNPDAPLLRVGRPNGMSNVQTYGFVQAQK